MPAFQERKAESSLLCVASILQNTSEQGDAMERYTLSDGYEMLKIGLGTFQMKPEEAEAAAASALAAGYRHIDTANICMNERAVGRAIKRSGIDRDEVFVSSKLWPSVYRAGAEAIDATLSRLDTDYLDMLILHQPAGDYVRAWKAMEDACAQGKICALASRISPGNRYRRSWLQRMSCLSS